MSAVSAPLRWRHVQVGDQLAGPDGQVWRVTEVWSGRRRTTATAELGTRRVSRDVDPDDVVPVLVPSVDRDAVELVREQLGGRLVERRTIPLPSDAR